jgi:hypothetical protein
VSGLPQPLAAKHAQSGSALVYCYTERKPGSSIMISN